MKTLIATLLSTLLLTVAPLSAQSTPDRNHLTDRDGGFTMRAGLGVAGIGGNELLDEVTLAWNIGLHYEWALPRNWGLDAGLEFSRKGGAMDNYKLWDDDSRTVMRLNYLQLPVVAMRHFRVGRVDLAPYAGIYYAWCASARLDTWNIDGGEYINVARKENQMIRRSDFGVRFGAGMSLRCGLYLGINADMGVVDFHHKNVDDWGVKFGCRTYTVSLHAGYNF